MQWMSDHTCPYITHNSHVTKWGGFTLCGGGRDCSFFVTPRLLLRFLAVFFARGPAARGCQAVAHRTRTGGVLALAMRVDQKRRYFGHPRRAGRRRRPRPRAPASCELPPLARAHPSSTRAHAPPPSTPGYSPLLTRSSPVRSANAPRRAPPVRPSPRWSLPGGNSGQRRRLPRRRQPRSCARNGRCRSCRGSRPRLQRTQQRGCSLRYGRLQPGLLHRVTAADA